ncbi:MAG TPA: phosphatase PAP2 family protein [Pyrinomonadaceae bacterium]
MTVKHVLASIISQLFLCLGLICASSLIARSQSPIATASPSPTPANQLEKNFFRNVLSDQKAIWTAPFHLNKSDAAWALPLTGATITLIATDRQTEAELVENGTDLPRFRISRNFSELGSFYSTGAIAAGFYLTGRFTHNARARETGVLAAEALLNGAIVGGALKLASQRERPVADDGSGEFWDGGSSFPSGHSISAWTIATVIAQEYGKGRPALKIGAYGLAAAVSISRYTGQKHFLSDVLVGSAIGYGVGRYVYDRHHDPALDHDEPAKVNKLLRSRLFPQVMPEYSPHAGVYGAALAWSF